MHTESTFSVQHMTSVPGAINYYTSTVESAIRVTHYCTLVCRRVTNTCIAGRNLDYANSGGKFLPTHLITVHAQPLSESRLPGIPAGVKWKRPFMHGQLPVHTDTVYCRAKCCSVSADTASFSAHLKGEAVSIQRRQKRVVERVQRREVELRAEQSPRCSSIRIAVSPYISAYLRVIERALGQKWRPCKTPSRTCDAWRAWRCRTSSPP